MKLSQVIHAGAGFCLALLALNSIAADFTADVEGHASRDMDEVRVSAIDHTMERSSDSFSDTDQRSATDGANANISGGSSTYNRAMEAAANAQSSANSAYSRANSAIGQASSAMSRANYAKSRADSALSRAARVRYSAGTTEYTRTVIHSCPGGQGKIGSCNYTVCYRKLYMTDSTQKRREVGTTDC